MLKSYLYEIYATHRDTCLQRPQTVHVELLHGRLHLTVDQAEHGACKTAQIRTTCEKNEQTPSKSTSTSQLDTVARQPRSNPP